MIDYEKTQPGDKLRITGMGAPGFAMLGDIVTVSGLPIVFATPAQLT